jgi:hypothetical protein
MSWIVMVMLLPAMAIKWSENKFSSRLGPKICLPVVEFGPPQSPTLRGGDLWTAIAYC